MSESIVVPTVARSSRYVDQPAERTNLPGIAYLVAISCSSDRRADLRVLASGHGTSLVPGSSVGLRGLRYRKVEIWSIPAIPTDFKTDRRLAIRLDAIGGCHSIRQ